MELESTDKESAGRRRGCCHAALKSRTSSSLFSRIFRYLAATLLHVNTGILYLKGHYTKRQKSYGNGFRVSADTETLLYTERNACPPGKKVVPNNRPANSDGHLVAGAADSSASEPPWDSARNDSIVASVPVWDH